MPSPIHLHPDHPLLSAGIFILPSDLTQGGSLDEIHIVVWFGLAWLGVACRIRRKEIRIYVLELRILTMWFHNAQISRFEKY